MDQDSNKHSTERKSLQDKQEWCSNGYCSHAGARTQPQPAVGLFYTALPSGQVRGFRDEPAHLGISERQAFHDWNFIGVCSLASCNKPRRQAL